MTTTHEIELKPCPQNCGADMVRVLSASTTCHWVECDCGWSGPKRANKKRAAKVWNDALSTPATEPQGYVVVDPVESICTSVRSLIADARAERDRFGKIAATIRINALHHGATNAEVDAMLSGELDFIKWVCAKVEAHTTSSEHDPQSCLEDDGCPTEKAVLKRFWREHQALAARPAPQPAADTRVVVKPLVWLQTADGRRGSFLRRKWDALSDFGVTYEIWDYDHVLFDTGLPAPWHNPPPDDAVRYCLNMDGRSRILQQYHPTLEAAQAAAQADYETRILSAIIGNATPAPSDKIAEAGRGLRPEAVEALGAYQQADMDGIMVMVSRQAIEECLPVLRAFVGKESYDEPTSNS